MEKNQQRGVFEWLILLNLVSKQYRMLLAVISLLLLLVGVTLIIIATHLAGIASIILNIVALFSVLIGVIVLVFCVPLWGEKLEKEQEDLMEQQERFYNEAKEEISVHKKKKKTPIENFFAALECHSKIEKKDDEKDDEVFAEEPEVHINILKAYKKKEIIFIKGEACILSYSNDHNKEKGKEVMEAIYSIISKCFENFRDQNLNDEEALNVSHYFKYADQIQSLDSDDNAINENGTEKEEQKSIHINKRFAKWIVRDADSGHIKSLLEECKKEEVNQDNVLPAGREEFSTQTQAGDLDKSDLDLSFLFNEDEEEGLTHSSENRSRESGSESQGLFQD